VAHSVSWLAESLRGAGHGVLVVAPEFPGSTEDEPGVVRIPAMQNFGGSDFSVPIPLTRSLHETIAAFAPDVVHSHHPFLLGDTALRVAASVRRRYRSEPEYGRIPCGTRRQEADDRNTDRH
jgi:1,2-diacylglycerol 3-alpha-glucosyltransferase